MGEKINQQNISAGEDVVGRDKITNNFFEQSAALDSLIKKFRNELEKKQTTEDTDPTLEYYQGNVDGEMIGLEGKLRKALIKEDRITRALHFKEVFYKALGRGRFYKSGQKIYSELMNWVYLAFIAEVAPLIDSDGERSKVDAEASRIIQDTVAKIGKNIDIIGSVEIEGILYYLTGNCHIKWHKEP